MERDGDRNQFLTNCKEAIYLTLSYFQLTAPFALHLFCFLFLICTLVLASARVSPAVVRAASPTSYSQGPLSPRVDRLCHRRAEQMGKKEKKRKTKEKRKKKKRRGGKQTIHEVHRLCSSLYDRKKFSFFLSFFVLLPFHFSFVPHFLVVCCLDQQTRRSVFCSYSSTIWSPEGNV